MPDKGKAERLALFGVKLRGEHVIARHGGGDRIGAVRNGGFGHVWLKRYGVEGVHEINVLTVSTRGRQITMPARSQLQPMWGILMPGAPSKRLTEPLNQPRP